MIIELPVTHVCYFCSCMLFVVVEPETTVRQCCIYLDVVCLFMRGEGIVEQDDLRAY